MITRVTFAARQSAEDWEESYAAGDRPGKWPYGLDMLQEFAEKGTVVSAVAAEPSLTSMVRASLRPVRKVDRADSLTVTWDEWTAARELASNAGMRLFSGVIWVTDTPPNFTAHAKKALTKKLLRRADGLWCLSRPQVKHLRALLGTDAPPIYYLPFGIDSDFFSFEEYPEVPLIASVGGDRDRDAATLFAALEHVHSVFPDVDIVIQSKSQLTPPPGVQVIQHLKHRELRDLYRRASVVAIATRPNLHASGMTVALEAMSTGRPVVMSGTPGISDYVLPNVTGKIVPVRDPHSLGEAVIEIIGDPLLGQSLGAAGRAHVEANHTSLTMAKSLSAIIKPNEN